LQVVVGCVARLSGLFFCFSGTSGTFLLQDQISSQSRKVQKSTANTKDPLAAIPSTLALFSVVKCCLPLLQAILEDQNPDNSDCQWDKSKVKGIEYEESKKKLA
jgi:hypothetical protein